MKKLGLFALAMALVMTLSQCKKEKAEASYDESVKVPITLNVSGGNGSRVDVNTENGKVTFENGDALYVASNGVYVGMLIYNGIKFSGEVTEPTEGQKLHFYFLGNLDTEETLTEGTSTGCSVVISDQTENLPVISYNTSRENYEVGRTDYNATLLNKCALVKFNVTTASNAATCIIGMNNKVTVDFETNEFDYSQEGDGVITMAAGNGEKWVILLPQDALEVGEEGSAYSEDGNYTGTRDAIPAIIDNGYLKSGVAITINTPVSGGVPTGAINGLFTINANGDQVYFSQGNLQYQASTNTWRFASSQLEYIGASNSNISPTYDGWIDLFGWGTSGWDCGNTYFHPWDFNNSSNGSLYGPLGNCELNGLYANSDWGVYNQINNGGNMEGIWRTLTNEEWAYVLTQRNTLSGIRYAKAQVRGVNGVILLPDDWNDNIYHLNNINTSNATYSTNQITTSQWNTIESHGVVFLSAAGQRNGTLVRHIQDYGCYWSATGGYIGLAVLVLFHDTYLYPSDQHNRFYGNSLRLVKDY